MHHLKAEADLNNFRRAEPLGSGSGQPGWRRPEEGATRYAAREHEEARQPAWDERPKASRWLAPALAGTVAALGAAAVYNHEQTRAAERHYPPIGGFLDVDGVRLHYIERGRGDPLMLIHGNGTMIQDFTVSRLVDKLAERYRVIAIDRPGYGYSSRPRRLWTPRAHARLFRKALAQLGASQALVYGHSWGTLVAIALALEFPSAVRGLVLGSGYYYPTLRADTFLLSPPAIPLIGDAMRYTVSPLVARAILPGMIKRMFQPAPVPERFEREFPKALMLRPLQLRAAAEDAAFMTPSVMELEQHYRELTGPVTIISGADDQIVDVERHSARLHRELPQTRLTVLPGLGHMIHHLAPDAVEQEIDHLMRRSQSLNMPRPSGRFQFRSRWALRKGRDGGGSACAKARAGLPYQNMIARRLEV